MSEYGIVAIIMAVAAMMVYGMSLSLDHTAACKQAAIAKDMPYLEIKELCK
jgi:hypothetical protein